MSQGNDRDTRLETRVIHAGEPSPRIEGAATLPIFQSTVFEHQPGASYDQIRYPRLNNLPNHRVLAAKLASLEGAEDALITGSGMAAIATTLLTVLGDGGHVLIQESLYGGTHSFVTEDLGAFGLRYDFLDTEDPGAWKRKLRPDSRAIYVETITNPLLKVIDHTEVIRFAREHGLVSIVDNTFASPVNFRPPSFGYDLSLHSATKYLNGHSDVVAGAVLGGKTWVRRIRHRLNHLGGCLDPHACFLLHRGLKTLVLRVQRQNETALRIARWLEERPDILAVHYPGLDTHPHHERAITLFEGCGGVLAFEPAGGAEAAARVVDAVRLPIRGPSLGGVESLITRPATTSHSGMTPEDRARTGVTDSLIRLSVGIEAAEDLLADLEEALARAAPRSGG